MVMCVDEEDDEDACDGDDTDVDKVAMMQQ